MDLKQLLGKLTLIEGSMNKAAGNPTGPKFTSKWQGTDAGTPGKKYVGDSVDPEESILKDLAKGPSPKTKEQELAEQFEQFLQQLEEENLGVENKRPARNGSRPAREYTKNDKPSTRYNYTKDKVKEDDEELSPQELDARRREAFLAHDEATADYGIAGIGMKTKRKFNSNDDEDIDEGKKRDPHAIVLQKLRDIERKKHPGSPEEQEMAYQQHVERMKQQKREYLKKNSNSIYKKVDEYGANNPPQATTAQPVQAAQQNQQQAQQAKNVAQGTQALKAAVGATASTDVLAKAIDSASQGTAIDATNAKAIEPMMDVIKQAAQDPNLANQFKSLANQAKTSAAKQTQTTQQKPV
jgi:hypothetical protein